MRTHIVVLVFACNSCGGDNSELFAPGLGSDAAVDATNDGEALAEASAVETSSQEASMDAGLDSDGAEPTDIGVEGGELAPSCADGVHNQGESEVDCGGPCPPCIGFHHEESFDNYQSWSSGEVYEVMGWCNDSTMVQGWTLGVAPDSQFPLASGYFPFIDTQPSEYMVEDCDDYLLSPVLDANQATGLTIAFDSRFYVSFTATAEVQVELDGVVYSAWSSSEAMASQRIALGPYDTNGAGSLRVLFRYIGSNDGFWAIDNVVIEGH